MRVAVAQIEPKLAEKERNLDALPGAPRGGRRGRRRAARPARVRDPRLRVRQRARRRCRSPRRSRARRRRRSSDACRRLGVHVVCGLLERDGDTLHNAAVLVGPDGLIGTYRKTHLPVPRRRPLRRRRATSCRVFDTPLGRIGLEICYDLRFPEVTRTLALAGADIVCAPTNLPDRGADPTRAAHARARGREPDLPARREPGRQGAHGRVLRPQPDRRPVRRRGSPRPTRRARRCSSPRSTSSGRATSDLPRSRASTRCYLFGHRRPELYGALVEETQSVTT